MTALSRLAAAAAATAMLGAAGTTLAQPPGPGGPPQQGDLPSILHLRPDQMDAYNAMRAASKPTPDELGRLRASSPQAMAGLPVPQRLDRIGGFLGTQEEMFHRSADATRAFYSRLSPDQQRTFDHVSAPRGSSGRPPE